MTTRAERMRAAADYIAETAPGIPEFTKKMLVKAAALRADADALEAVEREMRSIVDPYDNSIEAYSTRVWVKDYADRIRGEIQ